MDSRNTDRHLGNFGALIDNDTISVIRMAPVFDNNRSLLFDMDDDQLKNTDRCIGTCAYEISFIFSYFMLYCEQ